MQNVVIWLLVLLLFYIVMGSGAPALFPAFPVYREANTVP
jgi:hypothetical protein